VSARLAAQQLEVYRLFAVKLELAVEAAEAAPPRSAVTTVHEGEAAGQQPDAAT
jgi:hypothetical protein